MGAARADQTSIAFLNNRVVANPQLRIYFVNESMKVCDNLYIRSNR